LDKQKRIIVFVFIGVVFIFSFIFFTRIHPIVIFDTDDWLYTSYTRLAVPLWGNWNPARILPETLMSLSANIGVYVLNPIINDYIDAITISYGFVLSVCICIYLYRFFCLIRNRFNIGLYASLSLSVLFFLFHFWAFKHAGSNNDYFFRTLNATCYFYYVIPNILNASLVFYFLEKDRFSFDQYKTKAYAGLMLVCVYFLVFSNLYPSIILASFFSFIAIKYVFENAKTKTVFANLKQIQIPILGLLLWIISLVFEWKGGRATSDDLSHDFDFFGTVKGFIAAIIHKSNLWFLVFAIIVIVSSIIFLIINRKKEQYKNYFSFLGMSIYCIVLTIVYSILLCARVTSSYIDRSDILFTTYVFGFLLLCCLLCLFVTHPVIKTVLPLLLIIVCSISFTSGHRAFMESNIAKIDENKCKQIDDYIISQIKDAEAEGQSEVELHVPVFKSDNNWPLPEYGVQWIADTLYKQHIISDDITVTYCPDVGVNQMFGLEIP
jgi:hypothetical protein